MNPDSTPEPKKWGFFANIAAAISRLPGCESLPGNNPEAIVYQYERGLYLSALAKLQGSELFSLAADAGRAGVVGLIDSLSERKLRTGQPFFGSLQVRSDLGCVPLQLLHSYYSEGQDLPGIAAQAGLEPREVAENIAGTLALLHRLATLNPGDCAIPELLEFEKPANQRHRKGYGDNRSVLVNMLGDLYQREVLVPFTYFAMGKAIAVRADQSSRTDAVGAPSPMSAVINHCQGTCYGRKFLQALTDESNPYGKTEDSSDVLYQYRFNAARREFVTAFLGLQAGNLSVADYMQIGDRIMQELYQEFILPENGIFTHSLKDFFQAAAVSDVPAIARTVDPGRANDQVADVLSIYSAAVRDNGQGVQGNIDFGRAYWQNLQTGQPSTENLVADFVHPSGKRNQIIGRFVLAHLEQAARYGFQIQGDPQRGKNSLKYTIVFTPTGWSRQVEISPDSLDRTSETMAAYSRLSDYLEIHPRWYRLGAIPPEIAQYLGILSENTNAIINAIVQRSAEEPASIIAGYRRFGEQLFSKYFYEKKQLATGTVVSYFFDGRTLDETERDQLRLQAYGELTQMLDELQAFQELYPDQAEAAADLFQSLVLMKIRTGVNPFRQKPDAE